MQRSKVIYCECDNCERYGLQNFLAELYSGIMYAYVQNVLSCTLGGLRVKPAIPLLFEKQNLQATGLRDVLNLQNLTLNWYHPPGLSSPGS
jgi:hypothetical protein